MKNIRHTYLFLIAGLFFLNIQTLSAKIYPVVISEVFYDSPMEENIVQPTHHNGEFIELFNPTQQDIRLDNWTLRDKTTNYTFPANTTIPSRGFIIVAYQFPNSNFKLSDLFPSINSLGLSAETIQKNILYQSNIMLSNKSEIIRLYNENSQLIDQASYNHTSTFDSYNGYWDICAHNGSYANNNITNLVSLQRNNIHYSLTSITPLSSDFNQSNATPLQTLTDNWDYPILTTLYTDDEINNNPGNEVGAISADFIVSPSGAASYNIPIVCPTGINEMQPKLSIAYNSQLNWGELGVGWGISGLSAISRTTKSLHYDKINGRVVEFNDTDCLVFDGKRLILLSGNNLEPGAVYGTETEDYTRIIIKTKRDGRYLNLKYFEVQTKDGTIFEYGGNINSIVQFGVDIAQVGYSNFKTLSWKLNKVVDIYGNSIDFTYYDNAQLISKIEYAKTSSNSSEFILFSYKNNTINPKSKYIGENKVISDKIVTDISTYSNNKEILKYHCDYDDENRLKGVNLISNGKKMNPTSFSWGNEKTIEVQSIAKITSLPNMFDVNDNFGAIFFNLSDINGDGFNDCIQLLQSEQRSDYKRLTYLLINLYDKTNMSFSNTGLNYKQIIKKMGNFRDGGYNNEPKIKIADINNDGINEIIFIGSTVDVYQVNNDNELSLVSSSEGGYDNVLVSEIFDENNDGYNDLLLLRRVSSGETAVPNNHYARERDLYYGSVTGLVRQATENINLLQATDINLQYGDFNSDNKIDFVEFEDYANDEVFYNNSFTLSQSKTWGKYVSNSEKMYCADFNGDGRSDIIAQNRKNHLWKLYLNNGGYSSEPIIVNLPFPSVSGINYDNHEGFVIDYNGDGTQDFIIGDDVFSAIGKYQHTDWYFFKNINGNFLKDGDIITNQFKIPSAPLSITDINNDGVNDLIYTGNNEFQAFTMPNATEKNLIHSITNGMQQTYNIEYKSITNYVGGKTTGNIKNLNMPIICVDKYTNIDGGVTSYEYNNGLVSSEGKGFLGFKNSVVQNQKSNLKIKTNYELYQPSNELYVKSIETSTIDDKKISSNDKEYDFKIVDESKKRFIPIVRYEKSVDYLNDLITESSILEYDDYWNVAKMKNISGNITTLTNTTYQIRPLERGGLYPVISPKYLPISVEITKADGTDFYVRKSSFIYNENGSMISKTEDIDDENQLITAYKDFDIYGHPKTVTVSANGKTYTSNVTYTPSGRFIQTKTNILGETTNYSWDETLGVLTSETDNWEKTTTYIYDSWGKPKLILYPDGVINESNVQWTNSGDDFNAKYYSYSKTSGSSPIWIYYDGLGKIVAQKSFGLNEKLIYTVTQYDEKGRKSKISEPSFNSTPDKWTKYEYDEFNRLINATNSVGDIVSTNYNGRTTTITTPEEIKTTILNSAGQVDNITTNDKTVKYTYYPSGLTKTATPLGGEPLTMEYDLQGNRTKLDDPDAGVVLNKYNGFGELLWEIQKKNDGVTDWIKTTYNYDNKGILKNIERSNLIKNTSEMTTYGYDDKHISRIKSIEISGKNKQEFDYDDFGRITQLSEQVDGKIWTTHKGYNSFGQLIKETFPSDYYTINNYDNYGNLTQITDKNSKNIWQAIDENAKGQLLHIKRGSIITSFTYDERGLPLGINAPNIEDISYKFKKNGNLEYRTDNLTTQTEKFDYDNMNRLTNWDIYKNSIQIKLNNLTYNNTTSNIETKSDIGGFLMGYGETNTSGKPNVNPTPGPHALTSIKGVPSDIAREYINISYTDFKKIKTIAEGNKFYELTYGVDDQRRKSVYEEDGNVKQTRYYLGSYEEEIDVNSNIKKIHYLSGGAIMIMQNNVETLYYGYSDYQGSLLALAKENGDIERYAYDPWGQRRNPNDWTQKDTRTSWIINRGYTGHEHIDAFNIINMNGRVYDPLTASFLSPDPYVQAPDNWLNFNRYAYAYGNPLKYTDPTGEFIGLAPALMQYGIYTGMSYLSNVQNNGWNWNPLNSGTGAIAGGVSVNMSGQFNYYAGFSFDGNNYANIGRNYNGYTVGSSVDGLSLMENVGVGYSKLAPVLKDISNDLEEYAKQAYQSVKDWGGWNWLAHNSPGFKELSYVNDKLDAGEHLSTSECVTTGMEFFFDMLMIGSTMNDLSSVNVDRTIAIGVAKTTSKEIVKTTVEEGITTLAKYYPTNNGLIGQAERKFLMSGELIDRFGSSTGKYFSPAATPVPMRALPPYANINVYNVYKVVKPFEVEAGTIAPAFSKMGLGTQYYSPVPVQVLLKRGIIKIVP